MALDARNVFPERPFEHIDTILRDSDIEDYPEEYFEDVPDTVLDRSMPANRTTYHAVHKTSFISRNPMISYFGILIVSCTVELASRWVWKRYLSPLCKSAWDKLKSKYFDYKEKRQLEREKKEYYKELKACEDELEWKKRYPDVSTEYARANVLRNKAMRELISTED
jgi:hypothetical protein